MNILSHAGKIFLHTLLVCMAAYPAISFSHTECARPVERLFSKLNSNGPQSGKIKVAFADGGSSIYVIDGRGATTSELNKQRQVDRMVAMVLTAQLTGKEVIIRYTEDNLACPPSAGPARDDIAGIWLKN